MYSTLMILEALVCKKEENWDKTQSKSTFAAQVAH